MDNALCTNRGGGGGNLPRGCIATEALKIQECEDNFGCINATYPSIHVSQPDSPGLSHTILNVLTLTLLMASWACCMRALFVGVLSDNRWVQPR